MRQIALSAALAAMVLASPGIANSLVSPGPRAKIASSSISARPDNEWNKLSISEGKNSETWTLDGPDLNKVNMFGGIEVGKTLLRETDKKNRPLPRITPNMLLTDIPALLENSYRSQGRASQMTIDTQEPARVGSAKGIKFTYSFIHQDDEVERKGEAVGAIIDGRLYLVTYEAPGIYFFDKDLPKFRQLASTLKF